MIKLTKSEKYDPNYLCKVIKINVIKEHSNAEKLVCIDVDGNNIITSKGVEKGDVYVYFPPESKINAEYLSLTNSFRDSELNFDKNKTGFFEKNCRVKTMMLRGEPSQGYIVPISTFNEFISDKPSDFSKWQQLESEINTEFDTIDGKLLVEKYVVKRSNTPGAPGSKARDAKNKLLIPGQFKFHNKTTHLAKFHHLIKPNDIISITDKMHGTSFVAARVLVNKKLSLVSKIASWFGAEIETTEYQHIASSRTVIRGLGQTSDNYYHSTNPHLRAAQLVHPYLYKGETVYGEIVGFEVDGKGIQKGYDYGCKNKEFEVLIYRITQTNVDGEIVELSMNSIQERALELGVQAVPLIYYGPAKGFLTENDPAWDECDFSKVLLEKLNKEYVEIGNCKYCKNKVPSEGIVLRVEKLNPVAYKLKQLSFIMHESKLVDKGEVNIEDEVEEDVV